MRRTPTLFVPRIKLLACHEIRLTGRPFWFIWNKDERMGRVNIVDLAMKQDQNKNREHKEKWRAYNTLGTS